MTFSEEKKHIRQQNLLSQEEPAKEIGVSFATVNRWESGKNQSTYKALRLKTAYCQKPSIDFNANPANEKGATNGE